MTHSRASPSDKAVRVDAPALNDRLIRHLASQLAETEQRNALAWACRLREEGRLGSLGLLLEALLQAVTTSAKTVGKPFASPVPSSGELPTIQELADEGGGSDDPEAPGGSGGPGGPGGRPDMAWARDLVRSYSRQPAPHLFLGMQPKPRTGALCYMSVFGSS